MCILVLDRAVFYLGSRTRRNSHTFWFLIQVTSGRSHRQRPELERRWVSVSVSVSGVDLLSVSE